MSPETSLISHIIKTGDVVTPLSADVGKSFMVCESEWQFILEYYTKHKEAPSRDVFEAKFPKFDLVQTEGVIEHYIEQLHNYKARHTMQMMLTESANDLKAHGPYLTMQKMQRQLGQLGRDTHMVKDLDLVGGAESRLESLRERLELRKSGKNIIGVPSGIEVLDDAFGGWQRGDFIVVAGWTGSLKSWLALLFAINAWKEGYRVLYFSLEMSGLQIGYRMDTLLSGMSGEDFTNSGLTHATDVTYDHYKTWLGEILHDKHPFIVVTNEELDEVTQNTVQVKIEQWKPDLVILDYHGLFDDASGAMGETEKTKNLSKAFKRIAIKTGVPIIDITGVTMSGDHGERPPELQEMAWSKQLAYDSDLTLAVCKHGDELEVVSRKTRRGRDFRFWLDWDVDKGIVKEKSRIASANVFGKKDNEDEKGDSDGEEEPEAA